MSSTHSELADAPAGPERSVRGRVRLGRRTKVLVKRLGRGEIAVIDHRDVDRVSGEDLVASGVVAVIDQSPFSSGGYPNAGPLLLAQAGVHLIEAPDADLFGLLADGDEIEIHGARIVRAGRTVATGTVRTLADVERRHREQRADIGDALEAFARNTVEHMVAERELLSGELAFPPIRTRIRDRPVLIVVRGVDHQRDLRTLRPYIRDVKPAIIAVDGGANAVLSEGLRPDMIVGDMDSATPEALRCGAELIVHAYPDGRAPGRATLDELGLPYELLPAPGTSQDIAMLIAAEKGAELIVSVGSQLNLIEFLDKSRKGMSSTFLTRLRVGEILVDAKGVSRLYQPRPGSGPLLMVAVAGLAALIVIILTTPGLSDVAGLVWLRLQVLLGIG